MVIGLSGVQLTEWINAKGESDSSIKTMTKFEFETWHRLYTFINLKKKQQQQQGAVEFQLGEMRSNSTRTRR